MDPITININLNLSDEHVSQICDAIGCLAQIVNIAASFHLPISTEDLRAARRQQDLRVGAGIEVGEDGKLRPAAPKQDDEPEKPKQDDEPEKPKHTTEDVRNLVISLTHGGYKKEAAALVHKYAAKVTEVPESALDELYAALEQLGGITDVTNA